MFSSTQDNKSAQEWLLAKLLISFLLSAQVRYSVTKLSAIHGERNWTDKCDCPDDQLALGTSGNLKGTYSASTIFNVIEIMKIVW